MIEQVPRERRSKRTDHQTVDAGAAAAKAIELSRKEAQRKKRQRSVAKRFPKKLDPTNPTSWPPIDPERWLPKKDRSYYKPRRGHRKNQNRSGATQGAGYSALNDKYDYTVKGAPAEEAPVPVAANQTCLLYTSDAADDLLCVDLGGRRIIKKKK
eukprot:TRINITY_DN827_c0_g1_i1.p1 TRINITY_DN827_c0_g1~~TRINITY_DN827_c0_g1_i1.p1  ORF type:complete len:155 (-),score=68.81 TRINITY_DN827_c0_g1_i1:122-586(-)